MRRIGRIHDLGETGIANHHEVDVATRTLRTTGHGAEDEGRVDPAGERSKTEPQGVDKADRLSDQGLQLREHRVRGVRTEPHLVAHTLGTQQPGLTKRIQLLLERSRCGTNHAGEFTQMNLLLRPHEQQPQHLAPVLVGEEKIGKSCFRFQTENLRCLFRNTCIVRQETQSRQA